MPRPYHFHQPRNKPDSQPVVEDAVETFSAAQDTVQEVIEDDDSADPVEPVSEALEPVETAEEIMISNGFEPMPEHPYPGKYADAPYNGAPWDITEDGVNFVTASWKISRTFSRNESKWIDASNFYRRDFASVQVTFDPIGWRKPTEA